MNTYPKPSPFKLGTMAARKGTVIVRGVTYGPGLRGLPYGPGQRQDDYLAGYQRGLEQSQKLTA